MVLAVEGPVDQVDQVVVVVVAAVKLPMPRVKESNQILRI